MSDGVILVATGAGYVDLAVQCLASIRDSNPGVPVDLFTDLPDAPGVAGFDRVHPVPSTHPRVKLDCLAKARFDRVLFLDCDTLVIAPFGDLFDLADRFALSLAHDVRRRMDLIQDGVHPTPYAFPQLNSGVMLYRNDAGMAAFFAEWKRRYDVSGRDRDQPVLKDLLWDSDLRFYVLPPEFNLRRLTMLDAWEPLDAVPTIIHSHRLLQHLRGQGARVRTLDELRALERIALEEEWRADGGGAPWQR
ncbi:putative nucleotide-diphospho-sugar transferase [Thalassovita sp.]|uniref:putative nucleotide-diphospho-sugar transferase n=1 Tax=Thalassovita sp. TaxID=1979401 RepID=UPI002B26ABB2|nr:putative nucleotide-diphospho-sugar transferase [Thalassovita sp.]